MNEDLIKNQEASNLAVNLFTGLSRCDLENQRSRWRRTSTKTGASTTVRSGVQRSFGEGTGEALAYKIQPGSQYSPEWNAAQNMLGGLYAMRKTSRCMRRSRLS